MKRLGSHTGYLVINHKDSPGIRPEDVAHVPGAIAVPGGQLLERDTKTCTHCQRMVVLNPGRVRDRAVCPHCYHYICDECEAKRIALRGICVPFAQVLDRAQELADQYAHQPDHPDHSTSLAELSKPAAPTVTVPDVPRIVITDP